MNFTSCLLYKKVKKYITPPNLIFILSIICVILDSYVIAEKAFNVDNS